MADVDLRFTAAISGSRIELSDGSIWRVAPMMFGRIRDWPPGTLVAIEEQPDNPIWPQRLISLESDAWASVVPSSSRSGFGGLFG
ncbi:MAG TPA: hypothetical protein VF782_01745 [Allosphingosinicella sp.]|jgi:hypothetical protein